ncbi:MAG: hypothetical protein ACYC5K_08310, partial [Saccharofermentanales bacterium]
MKLTKSEIKYLSTSFVPQTPISIFANVEAQLDSSEYQSLVTKGVIVGNAYSQEALEMLTLLAKPDKGARFLAQTPDFIMEKYTYRIGDTLILAENDEGTLEFTKVEDVTTLASRFIEAFGMSGYGSTEIELVLTPDEMTVFLAFADLLRKRQLSEYAGVQADVRGFSAEEVVSEIGSDYKNGLTGLFLKNYRLSAPSPEAVRGIIASLVSKGIIADAGGYTLTGQYEHFARTFLIIETLAMYEAFGMLPGGEVATVSRIAASAGKNEAMAILYDGDVVQLNTTSPLQLLINIEAFMSCPTFTRPPEPPKPVAPPAPAVAPAPAAAAFAPPPAPAPVATPAAPAYAAPSSVPPVA